MSATLPKLTLKGMGCNPRKAAALKDGEPAIVLGDIMGIVTGIINTEDAKGDVSTALKGQFEGVNAETGEVFQSGKLYLPGGIHETLTAPFETETPPHSIQFALRLKAQKASNPIGYSYIAESLLPPSEVDALSALRSAVKNRLAPPAPGEGSGDEAARAAAEAAEAEAARVAADEAARKEGEEAAAQQAQHKGGKRHAA